MIMMKTCLFFIGFLLVLLPRTFAVAQNEGYNLRGLQQQRYERIQGSSSSLEDQPMTNTRGGQRRAMLSEGTSTSGEDDEDEGDQETFGVGGGGLGTLPPPCPPGSHAKIRFEDGEGEWFCMGDPDNDRRRKVQISMEEEDDEDEDEDEDGSGDGAIGVNGCGQVSRPPPCPAGAIAKFQPMDCRFFCMMPGQGGSGDDRRA